MQKNKIRNIFILLLMMVALEECLTFFFAKCFFEIVPSAVSATFIISFVILITLNLYLKKYQKNGYFKLSHIPLVLLFLFLAVHFRISVVWALNTFPLHDANTVLLTLQEPFDDFAYSMVKLYLSTTLPQTLLITLFVSIFLYVVLNNTKKRLIGVGIYFVATIVFFFYDIPIFDYIYILNGTPEKNASYSSFFVENYINPDSVVITAPEQKRNLILIYLESLETTFSDKEHGGNQESNLIPEITQLALHNINFGKNEERIGGGLDANGSNSTFPTWHTRSLGVPNVINYTQTLVLHHFKSLYKILNENGYKQVFFQGNPGLYKQFHYFATDQKIDEVYGPDDLIQRLNLDSADFIKKQGYKTVQDKDAFRFAQKILDTIPEPFSLTFFTIDTHAPHGLYDSDCVKSNDENDEDERLKAAVRCVSLKLDDFLIWLKSMPFYDNTTVVFFGDHRFMGTRLVNDYSDRKWVNVFVNAPKIPVSEVNRLFTDVDMFPTILSSMNFDIDGDRLGLGIDLFSGKKTLVESIGLDSLNKEIDKMHSHLIYESYLLKKRLNQW